VEEEVAGGRVLELVEKYLKQQILETARRIIATVNRTTQGWFEYFKHSIPGTFRAGDGWIRGRLRNILRKRSGRGRGTDHQRWLNACFAEQGMFSLAQAHAWAVQSSRR
jgi:RNA-directed DNA polymerase